VLDVETQVEISESRRKSRHEMVEENTQTEPSVTPRALKNKSRDVKPPTPSDDDDDATKRKHHHSKTDKRQHKHSQETESPSRKNFVGTFPLTNSFEPCENRGFNFSTLTLSVMGLSQVCGCDSSSSI